MGVIIKPIEEYLLNGGLRKSIYDFRNPSMESISYTLAYYDDDSDSLRTTILAIDEFPFEYCSIVYFQETLKKELAVIETKVLIDLEKFKRKNQSSTVKLRNTYDEISDRFKFIAWEIEKDIVLKRYAEIIDVFFSKIDSLAFSVLNSKKVVNETISFRHRCPEMIISNIYNLDIKHKTFIDRLRTTESNFLKVLTTKNTSELAEDIKIHIACDSVSAAYIFKKMEDFFYNLNPQTIGESGRFYSKGGDLISKGSLHTALNRSKGKSSFNSYLDAFFAQQILLYKKV